MTETRHITAKSLTHNLGHPVDDVVVMVVGGAIGGVFAAHQEIHPDEAEMEAVFGVVHPAPPRCDPSRASAGRQLKGRIGPEPLALDLPAE